MAEKFISVCFEFLASCFLFSDFIHTRYVVQDGGQKAKARNFEAFNHICVLSFAMDLYFDKQHDLRTYFIKLVEKIDRSKMTDQKLILLFQIFA
jgi:hypothetical protein